jgi:hypothetical protein
MAATKQLLTGEVATMLSNRLSSNDDLMEDSVIVAVGGDEVKNLNHERCDLRFWCGKVILIVVW